MIGDILILLVVSIFVSIITEQMLIRRLRLGEGIEVTRGRCNLKAGYGRLNPATDKPIHDIGEYSNNN